MTKAVNVHQMDLFLAVTKKLGEIRPRIPADNRSNAVIAACNMIVAAYSMSNEEFVQHFGETGERLPKIQK